MHMKLLVLVIKIIGLEAANTSNVQSKTVLVLWMLHTWQSTAQVYSFSLSLFFSDSRKPLG